MDSSTSVFQPCFRCTRRWNFRSLVQNPCSGDKLLSGPVHDRVWKQRMMDENFPPRSLLTASPPLFSSHSPLPRTDYKAEKRRATCDRSLLGSELDLSNTAAFLSPHIQIELLQTTPTLEILRQSWAFPLPRQGNYGNAKSLNVLIFLMKPPDKVFGGADWI